jgi:hypothetical protein
VGPDASPGCLEALDLLASQTPSKRDPLRRLCHARVRTVVRAQKTGPRGTQGRRGRTMAANPSCARAAGAAAGGDTRSAGPLGPADARGQLPRQSRDAHCGRPDPHIAAAARRELHAAPPRGPHKPCLPRSPPSPDAATDDVPQPAGTFKLTKGGASAQQAAAPALDLFGTLTRSLSRGAKSPVSGGGARDPGTVFVAGATGKLGIRIVRELLDAGFKVGRRRGGVRGGGARRSRFGRRRAGRFWAQRQRLGDGRTACESGGRRMS